MKKLISLLLILTVLLSVGLSIRAEEESIAKPGIMPDSPFYFLDSIGESIGMFFAFSSEAKIQKALDYAEEKLAEGEFMIKNPKALEKANARYEKYMKKVEERVNRIRERKENLSETVVERMSKHFEVLDRVIEKAPEQAREGLMRSRENSIRRYEKAIEGLFEKKFDKAIEINGNLLKGVLDRVKELPEEQQEQIRDRVGDYERFQGIFNDLDLRSDELRQMLQEKANEQIEELNRMRLNSGDFSEETVNKINGVKQRIKDRIKDPLRNAEE